MFNLLKKLFAPKPPVLSLTDDFNPTTFIGEGWTIIKEETDERGEALTELDLSKVRFRRMSHYGEILLSGEKKLTRSKEAGHIRLGGKAFTACWNNRHLLPKSWKKGEGGRNICYHFDGLVLLSPREGRYIPCFYSRAGEFVWHLDWLGSDFNAHYFPSAVLEI